MSSENIPSTDSSQQSSNQALSGMAMATVGFGALGFLWYPFGIIAIALGVLVFRRTKKRSMHSTDTVVASGGIFLGGLKLLVVIVGLFSQSSARPSEFVQSGTRAVVDKCQRKACRQHA